VLLASVFGGLVALLFLGFEAMSKVIPHIRWIAWAVILVVAVIPLLYLRMLWLLTGGPRPVSPDVMTRVPALLEAEDLPVNGHYNHVAGLSELESRRPWLRRLRTRLAMGVLNLFYRTEYVKGRLVTIPSIHFAQWSLVENGRYLLFLTNYDGPADSYLDDFFNSLALGVAFIWQDTKPYPWTTDPRRLKLWVREGQTLAAVRYRNPVYDGLTVTAINNNAYIRKRLLTRRSASGARRWLRRFTTTPAEPTRLSRVSGWVKELAARPRG
jgi:hypothetical protein